MQSDSLRDSTVATAETRVDSFSFRARTENLNCFHLLIRHPARSDQNVLRIVQGRKASGLPNTLSASLATECDLPPTSNDTWEPHVFPSAGNIEVKISDITLAKARTICDEKERKYDKDKAMCNASRVETCAVSIPEKPSFGGFCTAGGNKVHISVEALAKAEQLWKENEENVDMNSPYGSIIGGSDWPKPTKINDKPEIAQQSFDGFQTAGGSRVQASEKALTKARHILDQIESEIETEDEVPDNRGGDCFGFQTAGGSTIKVSDNAMSKAQSILRQIELAMENEISVTDEDPPSKREPINVSDSIKAQAIFREIENESTKAEPSNSIKRLRDANGCGTETPPKKYKPEIICNNVVNNISTSTPNLHGKTTNSSVHQNGKHELDHFFGDLDDHEFQQLFCGSEATAPYSRRVRPMKQVRLSNRFDECDKAHADDHHVPGEAHWDDSFGDVVAKLNSDGGLKVAPHIAEARKLSMQRQQSYIESKPLEERRPRLTEFISKKQMRGRSTLRQFVENRNPSCSVPEKLRDVIADNAMNFKFDMIEFYTKTECLENVDGIVLGDSNTTTLFFNERCQAGLPEFKLAFLASPGIDPALVPAGWIENCWVWTIIKLTSMERNLPDYFHGITTLENMLNQIMYRYHLEIDSAKRSVIRKMLEKDDIASKRMVLFVSRIFRGSDPFEVEIELCDGWYPIRSVLDFPLTQAILNGKITIGTKLMIQGAELLNLNEGCSPLEVPADVRLKIHANSTRRTRWDTRLGLFKVPLNFVISANDVLDRGGLIVSLEVIILRVYPLMFVDKTQRDALGSVLRSERVERRRTLESDSNRFESFQALFSQIQKDVQAEKVQPNGRRLISKLTRATTTAELVELMEAGLDVSCLEIELTSTQREAIMDHQRRKQEECIQEVNRRIKERMSSGESKRKVSSLLKMRITDARKPEKVLLLSIWRPPEELCDLFQETKVLEIRNVTANGTRNGEVQLTAGKNSSFKPLDQRQRELPVQQMRTLTRIADIETSNFRPMFNEFDTIGIVILVGAIESKKFQTVYLADIDKNLLCVNFWSGIKEYAYEDVVRERVVLCISNLQWRTINALSVIPTAFATEYTTFSEHSKSKHFVEEFQSLHATLKDVNLEVFYDECRFKIAELKDKKLPRYNGFQTPLRKSSTTTPMRCIPGASMNANTATPSDFSPGVGQPVSLQKRKLEQLAAYNSPPKLSPIIMRYNPRVRKNFKTPAKLEDRINQIGEDDSLC
ncbi:AAEL010133-PA [Aedes aegypti]|uniref:AAEL010133-PA n=1 Tax=Aedes aegypti TaxID=7159 RepID=Q16TT4_AEDAE|nr:AAEL010133-PA [Aedes aegypti]